MQRGNRDIARSAGNGKGGIRHGGTHRRENLRGKKVDGISVRGIGYRTGVDHRTRLKRAKVTGIALQVHTIGHDTQVPAIARHGLPDHAQFLAGCNRAGRKARQNLRKIAAHLHPGEAIPQPCQRSGRRGVLFVEGRQLQFLKDGRNLPLAADIWDHVDLRCNHQVGSCVRHLPVSLHLECMAIGRLHGSRRHTQQAGQRARLNRLKRLIRHNRDSSTDRAGLVHIDAFARRRK